MRNLKKILALVLALVMSMSLVVTANAFSDDDAINEVYREAATVLDGLKVLQGRDDGNFDPKANITRAEMAAIIYRIVTTDVEDKQTSIYAESSKLTDLDGAKWAAGYVGFCNNSNLILGYPDGTFQPLKNVTGHEALAMLLRAIGYGKNGEFVGKDWAINTAIYAKSNGLLKNINESTLSQPATREMVAEMAFRAMLAENVNWSLGLNYQPNGKTLGDAFGLKYVEGIVTANEVADLYSNHALAEGKISLDDVVYSSAFGTEAADLGEARYAYVANKDVLYMADNGTAVYDNEGAAVANVAKSSKAAGIEITDDTEKYVNFGGDGDVYESDYKLKYVVTFGAEFEDGKVDADYDTAAKREELALTGKGNLKFPEGAEFEVETIKNAADATIGYKATYSVEFRRNTAISQLHMDNISEIFDIGDKTAADNYIKGEVYVMTSSMNDISDELSYKAFCEKYIRVISSFEKFNSADNGEWLKVIDNDGDGKAEYAFLTKFVMTTVTDINTKKDTYTFQGKDTTAWDDTTDNADKDALVVEVGDVATEDELSVGDVILYTYIDGVYYVNEVAPVTETIDKKGIDYKAETIKCGETTYEWSGINYNARDFYHDVSEADTQVAYDLYLDHYGYVRLFIESAYNKGFVLLTDGYYETDRRDDKFQAQIWDVEAADYADVDVLNPATAPADTFIDTDVVDVDDEGTWKRLIEAGQVYFEYNTNRAPFWTNIAAFTASEDGYTLEKVQEASNRKTYDTAELNVNETATKKISVKEKDLVDVNGYDVQATTETLYYFVTRGANNKIKSIETWVGYDNAPKTAVLGADAVAYAVTSIGLADEYDVAEIVVFETSPALSSTVHFLYALGQKLIGNKFIDVYGLGFDGEGYGPMTREAKVTDPSKARAFSPLYPVDIADLMKFYEIDNAGNVTLIEEDYNDSNIYAGWVTVAENVKDRNYVKVETNNGLSFHFYKTENLGYTVSYSETYAAQKDSFKIDGYEYERTGNVVKTYGVDSGERYSAAGVGDQVIFYTNAKGEIQYIINVTESTYFSNTDKLEHIAVGLEELWQDIHDDQSPAPVVEPLALESLKIKDTTVVFPEGKNSVEFDIANSKADDDTTYALCEVKANYDDAKITVYQGGSDVTANIAKKNIKVTDNQIFTIVLERNDETVTYIAKAKVQAKLTTSALTALSIKGVSIDPAKFAKKTDKAFELTDEIVISARKNFSDTLEIDVTVTNNATWSVADDASGMSKGDKDDLTPGTYDAIIITVTPESGAGDNITYTLTNLKVVDKVAVTFTATGDVKDTEGTSIKDGTSVFDDEAFTFVAEPSVATNRITGVTYKVDGGSAEDATVVDAAAGKYSIPVSALKGAGTVAVTITEGPAPEIALTVAKDGSKVGYANAAADDVADTDIPADKDLVFYVAATANNYIKSVTVEVDGVEVDYTVDAAKGKYTVDADLMTGKAAIAITVDMEPLPVAVTVTGLSGAGEVKDADDNTVGALKTITHISNTEKFVFTVDADTAKYASKVTYKVGNGTASEPILPNVDGEYTIDASALAGATKLEIIVVEGDLVTVTAAKAMSITYTLNGNEYTVNLAATKTVDVVKGSDITVKIPSGDGNLLTIDDATKGDLDPNFTEVGKFYVYSVENVTGAIELDY